jgi:hypothetical protein
MLRDTGKSMDLFKEVMDDEVGSASRETNKAVSIDESERARARRDTAGMTPHVTPSCTVRRT